METNGLAAAGQKIAYLLSQYPAVSHTFFLQEVLALRGLGFRIETASINTIAAPVDGFSPAEKEECARTFYVKGIPKVRASLRLLRIALRHPIVLRRGIQEALALDAGDLRATLKNLLYLAEALLAGAWMRQRGCTHLHVHFSGPVATVAMLTSVAWRVPYSLTVHGPDEFYSVDRLHLARKLQRARFIVCISSFCRSQLLRVAGQEIAGKIYLCRLGIDPAVFFPAGPSLIDGQVNGGVTRLVCVGRLHPSKGHLVLLEALESLKAKGYRLHLDLVGGGERRTLIEQAVQSRGLGEQVTLHGATSHARTRALLEHADLFVLASFAEGIPVALMEAMAMEIACVSTFVAGIPELIVSGVEGVLVAPSAVEELAAAIAGLLDDPARRKMIAAAGRAKVLREYDVSRNIDRLAEVFRGEGLG